MSWDTEIHCEPGKGRENTNSEEVARKEKAREEEARKEWCEEQVQRELEEWKVESEDYILRMGMQAKEDRTILWPQ